MGHDVSWHCLQGERENNHPKCGLVLIRPCSAPGTADPLSASDCFMLQPRGAKEREETTDPSLPKSSL